MLSQFKENKALTLLVSLMFLILFFPFFETSRVAHVVFILLYTSVLLSGIYAISYDARYIAIGILLAAPIFVCQWSNIILNSAAIDVLERVCTTIFMTYTLVALLEHVFRVRRVGLNEIYGSICAFILIGMVFGFIYLLIETAAPGSFRFSHERSLRDASPFLFFSFSALAGGGSDISAAAPFAKSLALIEVLIGVIYVAVLIGRLVSASFLEVKEENLAVKKHLRQKQLHERLREETPLRKRPIGLVISCVMINFAASLLMIHFNLPFFLDSWGTSLAVILGGWWTGAVTAAIYNLLIAATYWGWPSWIWVFSSLLVAAMTWFFHRRGWITIYKPLHLTAAGMLTGLLNGIWVQITIMAANLPPYEGTMPVYSFFLKITHNDTFAALAEKMFVETADKTISIWIAAVAVFLIHDVMAAYKKNLAEETA